MISGHFYKLITLCFPSAFLGEGQLSSSLCGRLDPSVISVFKAIFRTDLDEALTITDLYFCF